jgi:hypothetical protein
MEAQLRLLTPPVDTATVLARSPREGTDDAATHIDPAPPLDAGPLSWRLSDTTRALGRRGIEHAREALHRARTDTAA